MIKLTSIHNQIKNHCRYYFSKLFMQPHLIDGLYGIKYVLSPGSSLDETIKKEGTLDDWNILKQLIGVLPAESVIFDIGANVGHLSLLFAKKIAPHGFVFSYEPDPENRSQLIKNKNINAADNITIIASALQNEQKMTTTQFNIRRSVDGNGNQNRGLSSLKKITKFTKSRIKVPVSTIDKEYKRLNLSSLDFIKIDVEGAEFLVLKGGEETIAAIKPIIQYEYSNVLDSLMKEDNTVRSFMLLKKLGYRQYYEKTEGVLMELKDPDTSMKDVNMVCFHKDKMPKNIEVQNS